jgi:hypothetical protein
MKKYILLSFIGLLNFSVQAQIICIKCFHQNDSIGYFVNNRIINGSFENTTCGTSSDIFCPNSNYYACDIDDWQCTGGGIYSYCRIYHPATSFIPHGFNAPYLGNSYCKACSSLTNDTSCITNVDCTVSGIPNGYPLSDASHGNDTGVSIEQTVPGLIPGNTYVLEFWAGGEYGSWVNQGIFGVDVGFGKTLLRNWPTSSNSIGDRFIIEFIASSTSHTIKFTNWGHICNTCTELIIDDVRLYTPAELPSTFPSCGLDIYSAGISPDRVFPNPASDRLNIELNDAEECQFIIYDGVSREVLSSRISQSAAINIERLENGIYFYSIINKEGHSKQGQFIKNNYKY